jgi:CubicO group peptidase (beta-lactamase class C family)
MARDALFQIASMAKPIVSVATLQLVEQGRMRLDDPISRWLPEFADAVVLDDPAGPLHGTHPAPRPACETGLSWPPSMSALHIAGGVPRCAFRRAAMAGARDGLTETGHVP